jgi:hypothetical protein
LLLSGYFIIGFAVGSVGFRLTSGVGTAMLLASYFLLVKK